MSAYTATGSYYITNGQIISPTGSVYTAKGINLYDSQMGDAAQILKDLPGINFIRLNVYSYQSPSTYAAFVNTMTAAGVVVEFEDHTNSTGSNAGGSVGSAFTGTQLSNELAWYASMASYYKSNTNVWFGTDNEPPAQGLSTWEQETYNAIRNTGNNSIVMMELPGGGDPGLNVSSYGMTESDYASMTNIAIDAHFYGWDSNYSTTQSTVNAALTTVVNGAQTITSANGTVPVIIGEYGPSTNGMTTDANASQVETAVQTATDISGSAAWGWDSGANDDLSNGSGVLTSYGQEVAAYFATTASKTTPVTPSANDTVVKAGSTAAITDASGNKWTITSGGLVAVNGTADTTTANVIELAYVNGTVWQENASDLWWYETAPGAGWSGGNGIATSPLPVVIVASANDTAVIAGSGGTVTDASGNKWTITSGYQVAVNGTADTTTANVIELAYVNGAIWQENASGLWWDKTTPSAGWSGGNGIATSPLPTTASVNDTTVLVGSSNAIVDASGNKWTITSTGLVAVNGTADTTTANVMGLSYVNGVIWQVNTSNLWWYKSTPSVGWSGGNGIATSPLPATIAVAATATSTTVSASEVTVAVTSGTHMLFISGSDDVVSLVGGTSTITETGTDNTYLLPVIGKGTDTFTSDILNIGDTLDLKTALAGTNWNGATTTLANYLKVTDTATGAVIGLSSTSGGTSTTIATITGATSLTYAELLTHAVT